MVLVESEICLPGRSFEGFDDLPLSLGAVGDVIAARSFARDLLEAGACLLPDVFDPVLATLVLTAVCLHVHAALGEDMRRGDILRFLGALMDLGRPSVGFAKSPMQFVRYAALELQALTPTRREPLLQTLIKLVREPDDGGTHDGEKVMKNACEGRI